MLLHRVVADYARALLPFPFSQRRAMCANVGSESGWNAAATVISEFLLVHSLPRHSRFMFRACARTKSSSTRSFVRFVRGAIRTTRSLVHHSWVTREMDLLTLSSLRAGWWWEEIILNLHARNRTRLSRLDYGIFIIIEEFIVALYSVDNWNSILETYTVYGI